MTDVDAAADDAHELALLRRGDADAFARLVRRLQPSMLRAAATHVRGHAVAEEVVQDTWLAVVRGLPSFQGRSSVRTWIFAVLANQARTRGARESRSYRNVPWRDAFDATARADGRLRPGAAWHEDPERRAESSAALAALARTIGDLPSSRRRVLVLRDVEGWSAPEVSAWLGVTEAHQRVLLHRARAALRDRLAAA